MNVQVGIDLGTTNTLVSSRVRGKMKLISMGRSNMLPSVMYVERQDGGSIKETVGYAAQNKGKIDPDNFIRSSKTHIGLTGAQKTTWTCCGREYTPTDVAAKILEEAHKRIRKELGLKDGDVVQAVITVPAYFSSTQTEETKRAGERAGMEVLRIVSEPMAAAVSAAEGVEGKIFVVDLGGGTFDVCVLDIGKRYETLKIDGERKLGGDDFDDIIVDHFLKYIEDDLLIDLSSQDRSGLSYDEYNTMMSKIRDGAIETKIALSDGDEYEVNIPDLFTYGEGKKYHFEMPMTRDEFNDLCAPLFDKVIDVIDRAVTGSGKFTKDEIVKVYLVGGSCYIPKIQEDVDAYFNMTPDAEYDRASQVAMGAGLIADMYAGMADDPNWEDPFGNMLRDITSHDMGIEVIGDDGSHEFDRILEGGTNCPCELKKTYRTVYDDQDSVVVKVYEKIDRDAPYIIKDRAGNVVKENETAFDFYGSFVMTGLTPAPAGETEVEVTFAYDASRIFYVTAKDVRSGKSQTVELHKGESVEVESSKPTDLFLLIDISGSMRGNRIQQAKYASSKLVKDKLDLARHRLGIITFGSDVRMVCDLTHDKERLLSAIDSIDTYGQTLMHKAISLAAEELAKSSNERAIIIVTDGSPDSKSAALDRAEAARRANIAIAAIGVEDAEMDYLRTLTANDKFTFEIDDASKLMDAIVKAVEGMLKK